MELLQFKVVISGDTCNVISDEDNYYATGISRVRKLKGDNITIMYLSKKEAKRCTRKIGKIYKKC